MSLKELNETIKKFTESVEEENEKAELKRKLNIYIKAYESLEDLQELLTEGIDPRTKKLDADTEKFYDLLTNVINEIYSRSQAFEE